MSLSEQTFVSPSPRIQSAKGIVCSGAIDDKAKHERSAGGQPSRLEGKSEAESRPNSERSQPGGRRRSGKNRRKNSKENRPGGESSGSIASQRCTQLADQKGDSNVAANYYSGAFVRWRRWLLRIFEMGDRRRTGDRRDGPAHRANRLPVGRPAITP